MPEPPAGHSPDVVDQCVDVKQLPLTDPRLSLNEPPQDAQLFERQIGIAQGSRFHRGAGVDRPNRQHEGVNRKVVNPLAEGEAGRFWDGGRPGERPFKQFHQASVNRRIFRDFGHPRILNRFAP
jgi:hypothetical protein